MVMTLSGPNDSFFNIEVGLQTFDPRRDLRFLLIIHLKKRAKISKLYRPEADKSGFPPARARTPPGLKYVGLGSEKAGRAYLSGTAPVP